MTILIRDFVSEEVASPETPDIDLERFKRSVEIYFQDLLRALNANVVGYGPPIVVASVVVDLPSIPSNGSAFVDVTPATAVPLGTHIISWAPLTDATSIDDLMIQFLVVAANTVRITMQNPTPGPIDPASITFQFITATATDT